MESDIKKVGGICCPKCGGDLTLQDNVIGICLYCESAYLLTEEEASELEEKAIGEAMVHPDCAGIVSKLCRANRSWIVVADNLYVSSSMKHSVLHKRRMRKVKKSFDIPDEDDVFVIADTALKSYTEGLAVCTSGIYYIENSCKEKGRLTWKEFKTSRIIAAGKNLLLINDLYFYIYFSARDVARVLKTIQQNI